MARLCGYLASSLVVLVCTVLLIADSAVPLLLGMGVTLSVSWGATVVAMAWDRACQLPERSPEQLEKRTWQ